MCKSFSKSNLVGYVGILTNNIVTYWYFFCVWSYIGISYDQYIVYIKCTEFWIQQSTVYLLQVMMCYIPVICEKSKIWNVFKFVPIT